MPNILHINGERHDIGTQTLPVGHYSPWSDGFRIFVATKDKRPDGSIHYYGNLERIKRTA